MRTPEPFPLPGIPTPARDLVALGVSRRRLAVAADAGRLLRVRRGVYLDPARWPPGPVAQHLLRAHAEQAVQPAAVVSHWSAAAAWGLPTTGDEGGEGPVWVTLPAGREFRSGRSPGVVRVVGPLPGHHLVVSPAGFPVTTVARTAADLARDLDLPTALMVLDAALRLICGDLTVRPRRADYRNPRLAGAARVLVAEAMQRQGMGPARRALGLADPARESPIES